MFRYTLMSAIVDSQQRHKLGVLKLNPDKFVRQDSYREIRTDRLRRIHGPLCPSVPDKDRPRNQS